MSETEYVPPKIWEWDAESGGRFANINRPIAGATHDKELPIGDHPYQLYSLGTPNGVKVTVMLEELLALGHEGAEYDAWLINIGEGDQFGSDFVGINPNSKIPAMMDRATNSRCGCLKAPPCWCIWLRNLMRFYRMTGSPAPRPLIGCSGKWAQLPIWAAASGIFTLMRRLKWNIRLIALQWK